MTKNKELKNEVKNLTYNLFKEKAKLRKLIFKEFYLNELEKNVKKTSK